MAASASGRSGSFCRVAVAAKVVGCVLGQTDFPGWAVEMAGGTGVCFGMGQVGEGNLALAGV